jgi:hypothetical protein
MTQLVVRQGKWPKRSTAARLAVESLEQRLLLATFNVTTTDDSGQGSLRWAIEQANLAGNAGEVDRIEFNLAGTAPFVISPAAALPEITEAVIIDGRTQPGYAGAPLVEISGSLAGDGADGLLISSGGSQVLGLAIHGFGGNGIALLGGSSNLVQGCYIGTDMQRAPGQGNGLSGILIFDSSENLIGGTGAGEGNLIVANAFAGVEIAAPGATGNTVSGNWIGTDTGGADGLGNTFAGVLIDGSPGNTVSDNIIVFSQFGIIVLDGDIGEIPDPANGNLLRRNSIFGHSAAGIDLAGDGPTQNDDGDADVGPNGLQNFPVITSAQVIPEDNDGDDQTDGVRIAGLFNGKADTEVTLDFFLTDPVLEPGLPQGRRSLGSQTITTDAFGQAVFDMSFDGLVGVAGSVATMTATTADGTSEFSAGLLVTGDDQPAIDITPNPISGQQHRRLALVIASFTDELAGTVAEDYTVIIDWGDGVLSGGLIQAQDGLFFITAFHRYSTAGDFNVTIQVSHGDNHQGSAQTTASITPNELSGSGQEFSATAGRQLDGQLLATFSSERPDLAPGDFAARVNWGDGESSAGQVTLREDGFFEVRGSHTYTADAAGERTVTIIVEHIEADLGIVLAAQASILPPPAITAAGINVAAVAGTSTGLVRVASFVAERDGALASDFWATIDWGDGTRSRGIVTASPKGDGRFAVSARHAWRRAGGYDMKVIIRDLASDATRTKAACRAKVAPAPWAVVTLPPLSAGSGQEFAARVMSFKTANLLARAGEFFAKINWGDGVTSRGEVRWRGDGTFEVRGVHTYSQLGILTLKVRVTDRSGNELVYRAAVAVV